MNVDPLSELASVRQTPGEPRRRWFTSEDFDLIVWYGEDGAALGLQLCYDKRRRERAITWKPGAGFRHSAIDDGEAGAGQRYKSTPVLGAGERFDAARVWRLFRQAAGTLPADIVALVRQALAEHPSFAPDS